MFYVLSFASKLPLKLPPPNDLRCLFISQAVGLGKILTFPLYVEDMGRFPTVEHFLNTGEAQEKRGISCHSHCEEKEI